MSTTFFRVMRKLDMFATEPNVLTFGDPDNPKTREMWKTSCGGCSSICFVLLTLTYVAYSAYAITTGDKDSFEVTSEPIPPDYLGRLTFEDMLVMPVVHFDYLANSVYLDPQHPAFTKNIFVALEQTKRFANGTKTKEFNEFVPCT